MVELIFLFLLTGPPAVGNSYTSPILPSSNSYSSSIGSSYSSAPSSSSASFSSSSSFKPSQHIANAVPSSGGHLGIGQLNNNHFGGEKFKRQPSSVPNSINPVIVQQIPVNLVSQQQEQQFGNPLLGLGIGEDSITPSCKKIIQKHFNFLLLILLY